MNEELQGQIQNAASSFIGEWGWLFLVGLAVLMFRTTISSLLDSVIMFIGSDFTTDDVVIIDGKPARIIRKGIWKTVFFIYTIKYHQIVRKTKLVVLNEKLKDLKIEKPLPDLRIQDLFYINGNNGDKK